MSFNMLRFGLNLKTKIDTEIIIEQAEEEILNKSNLFPNCVKMKRRILILRKKMKMVNEEKISNELKEKKLQILNEELRKNVEELYEKLSLHTPNEIDPLCSFEEMQKKCKLTKEFPTVMTTNYKFSHPTPIQSSVISLLNNKHNLIATSETGSGKTLSYLIPTIHLAFLNKIKENKNNKVLIVLPTKELCKQIYNEALIFSNYYTNNKVKVKYLNKSMIDSVKTNYDNFMENNDIFIATPKPAHDLLNLENKEMANRLSFLILDEADKFFDLGFIEIIDEILFELKDKENVAKAFFSATIAEEIENIITTHILDAYKVAIGSNKTPSRSIKQKFIYCTNEEGKLIGIRNLFKDGFEPPMLVFVEGINKLKYVYDALKYDMPKTAYLHSKMTKKEREEIVRQFRVGEIWILICTDLLARGIDFKNVKSVLNFDCPYNPINYIHKIGRTGRAGKTGKSFTFVVDDDIGRLRNLSKMLNDSVKYFYNNIFISKEKLNVLNGF